MSPIGIDEINLRKGKIKLQILKQLTFLFGGRNPVSFSNNLTLGRPREELARGQSSLFVLGQP